MIKHKSVLLLIASLLLVIGCVPSFPSFLLVPTPTPSALNIERVMQVVPSKNLFVSGLVWSPDGTKLAISYSRIGVESSSLFQIYVLDVQSNKINLIEESNEGLRSVTAWLPNDHIAFYANGDMEEGTWLMKLDRNEQRVLVVKDIAASWSSNGQSIAYWKLDQDVQSASKISIFIHDLMSGDEQQVFSFQEKHIVQGVLQWSSDESRLLFTLGASAKSREEAFRNVNIYILELATGNTSRLTQEGYYGYVSWSLDQKLIAYTYQNEPSNQIPEALYIMRSDGDCPVQIIESPNESFGGVSWSPDGRWIAFAWDKGVYLLDTSQIAEIELLKNGSSCP